MIEGRNKTTLALALTATLLFSGCVGTGDGESLNFLDSEDGDATGEVRVVLDATGVSETDISHLGLAFEGIFLHEASIPLPDGYHELDLQSSHADVVSDGASVSAVVANGSVPAGTYDQLRLKVDGVETQKGSSSGSGSGHDHGGSGGHDHGSGGHGSNSSASASSLPGVDVPINVTFPVEADRTHQIKITLDVAESTADDGFTPAMNVTVVADGDELAQVATGDEAPEPSTPPPAARMAVFAPNGDQVYEPGFTVEQNVFVNSKSSAFSPGEDVRFSGTESEATADGASISSYEWDLGDGTTAEGPTVSHAYDQQGVFEVELTVTDSLDVSATHTVRVVVLQTEWTATLVDTGFEDGPGDWTTSSNADSTPAGEVGTTWALDGAGRNGSSAAWHVGHHLAHPGSHGAPDAAAANYPGYTSGAEATLTSPTFTIPSNWTNAGYRIHVGGGSEAGFDPLTITYSIEGGGGGTVAQVDQAFGWVQFEDLSGLSDAVGKEVQFEVTFTSDGLVEQGPGFYVDDFAIGGVDIPIKNAHLLEESGHDGHDHSH